ncbi:MAG: CHAT domain-containing tetratricopeptide repeat protein [Cyclobacteriaceae bacterium]
MQCFLCLAQISTPLEAEISEDFDRIFNHYFYTQPDSAIILFKEVARKAQLAERWDLQITALMQASWCADYHTRIDTLQYYLNQTEQLLHQHALALDTLDPEGAIATDVAYTRGVFYYSTGDFAAAVEAFDEIVQPRSLAQISDSVLVTDVFAYLGSAFYRLQNYQKALDYYLIEDRWLPYQVESIEYNRSYRKALNSLYRAQSEYALAKYEGETEAFQEGKNLVHQAFTFLLPNQANPRFRNPILSGANVMASIFQEQQQYDSALYYLELALPLQEKQNTKLIDTYNQLGNTYALMHRYPEAMDYYQQSKVLADRLLPPKHFQRGIVHTLIGKALADQDQWKDALDEYQLALAQFVTEFNASPDFLENPPYQDSGAKKELLEVFAYKAEALWELYQQQPDDTAPLRSALEIYHQIGEVLNTMRNVFPSIEYKQFIASRFFSIYEQAIRVAYEMHQRQTGDRSNQYLAEAFHFAERSKSIVLLEATVESQARHFSDIPTTLLEQEREYTRKRSFLERQLSEVSDPGSLEATTIRQQILATQDAYQDLMKRLEQEYPKYYALKHDTEVTSLASLQKDLTPGATLFSYFYGDSTLFAFGISADAAFMQPITMEDSLRQRITRLITYSSRYEWKEANTPHTINQYERDGYLAYRQLMGNLLDSLGGKPEKLIIIPDGQLGYLPFDVLLTDSIQASSNTRYASLPYLLKQYPLRYEYSATLFTHQFTENLPQTSQQYAYTGFAPLYDGRPSLLAENELTRSMGDQTAFSNLLYNKEEVEEASELFESKIFVDNQATEQAFKEYATRSKMLHLSMHAFANDAEPLYSGLVFSQSDTSQEDNFLYAYELYNMKLQADLAVLSACETGIGKLARGEGIMSLGRAFKYAGCPNVAMSLWKVNDRTTQHIVQAFFRELADGKDKDEALRQAKLSFLADAKGPLAHPYYWASLALIGDDAPVADPAFSNRWFLLIGIGLFLFTGGFLLTQQLLKNRN